ncbi:MAG: ATP synthase F1 subunit epsilon [Thermodesulfobacteriota bacterium]
MTESIHLKVITPVELVLDEQVSELTAPGELGEFGILPGHIPFVSILQPGELRYMVGSKEQVLIIDGGLADVKNDVVNILTDLAQSPSGIDIVAANKEVEILENELSELNDQPDKDKSELERGLKLARVRAGIK